MRFALFVAAVSFLGSVASMGCGKKEAPAPAARETVELTRVDAGDPSLIVGARPPFPIPREDLPLPEKSELAQNQGRIAYRVNSGVRILYVVGDRLIVGAKREGLEWSNVPTFAAARAELYARGQREQILAATNATESADVYGQFLASITDVPDQGEWWKSYEAAPEKVRAQVLVRLTPEITGDKPPTYALFHAVQALDLKLHSSAVLLRLGSLLTSPSAKPEFYPAISVMIRSTLAEHGKDMGAIACRALTPELAKGRLAAPLVLAIALSKTECAALTHVFTAYSCDSQVRCSEKGPIRPSDTSKQDEPLCTQAEALAFAEREAQRTPKDVLESGEPSAALLALAALAPSPEFVRAHERRRFQLVQTDKPECSLELKDGTACHCSEAVLRDAACRAGEVPAFTSGACAFAIDAAKKTLSRVSSTRTPR
jgi:hypothetical protein